MPRKKSVSKSEYTRRANLLRSVGYKLSYKGNNSKTWTPQNKAIITTLWEDKGVYYLQNTEKNRLEFKRIRTKASRKRWESVASSEQIFPDGVFVQRPKDIVKGDFRIRVRRSGEAIISGGKGRIRDVALRLNMSSVAKDPEREIRRVLKGRKRPAQLLLTANGFQAGQSFNDLEEFNRYLEEELIPKLDLAEFDYDKWGNKVFGIRLVYTPKGKKKVKGEGKVFDFEKGGIFDSENKRVYGLKNFRDRKRYLTKKGKKKGK